MSNEMRRYRTLEESQLSLIELLEEGWFRGSADELSRKLGIRKENIDTLLRNMQASGDIIYERNGNELVIRPATFIKEIPHVLTAEPETEIPKKISEGYKAIASTESTGIQSRELRGAIGKVVTVFFRNSTKVIGKLMGFDRYVLKLKNPKGNYLAFKHAVTTIVYKP